MFRRWEREDGERGATLVEYALVVALVAFVASVGVQGLQAAFSSDLNVVKRQISVGDRNLDVGDNTTTSSTTTTTTAPPTTTTTTTTTTAPTTTTSTTTTSTTTTTTTAPASKVVGGSFSTPTTSTGLIYGFIPSWSASTTLTLKTSSGQLIAGASVTVKMRYTATNVGTYEPTLTFTTGANGTVTLNSEDFANSDFVRGSSSYSTPSATFTLIGVTNLPSGFTWNGTQAAVTANQP